MKKRTALLLVTAMVISSLSVGIATVPADTVKTAKVKSVQVTNLKERSVTVKWKKTKNAAKYQVSYSTNKNLKSATTKTVSKNKATVKKLKSGTKYYFRVRAISNTGYAGKWSKTVSASTVKEKTDMLDSTEGYFNLKIVGDGKTTNMKIKLKAASKDTGGVGDKLERGVKIDYSASGTNKHNFKLEEVTNYTQLSDEGNFNVIMCRFSYTKPANYTSTGSVKGNFGSLACGWLDYNSWAYPSTTNPKNTMNSAGLNTTSTTEYITAQIDVGNAGLMKRDGKNYHATMTVNLNKAK